MPYSRAARESWIASHITTGKWLWKEATVVTDRKWLRDLHGVAYWTLVAGFRYSFEIRTLIMNMINPTVDLISR
ncbi:hypothetical protein CY34DRAFT_545563 [Suillus luteus UH-Slu-Lm8-n1]|uniref:Uncharacterized protein n=1 Tax=Suillus luteus UH-Slu-Lm8-n1 TaxID=930992 RepID=A0A0D0ANZ3_9AGAM|nr:hypothetical protein CY34DRAFT_545563 [Suillus luteus UH-Slu-Lm8-n1]